MVSVLISNLEYFAQAESKQNDQQMKWGLPSMHFHFLHSGNICWPSCLSVVMGLRCIYHLAHTKALRASSSSNSYSYSNNNNKRCIDFLFAILTALTWPEGGSGAVATLRQRQTK